MGGATFSEDIAALESSAKRKKIHFPRNYSAVISKIQVFLLFAFPFLLFFSCFSREFCFLISQRARLQKMAEFSFVSLCFSFLFFLLIFCRRRFFSQFHLALRFSWEKLEKRSGKARNGQLQGLIVYENVWENFLQCKVLARHRERERERALAA